MLWEVSVLNKIYKTNLFCRIKPRALNGKPIYVLSEDLKFTSVMAAFTEGDTLTCSSDEELLSRYYITIDNEKLKMLPSDYLQNLLLYDCILILAEQID